MRGVGIHLTLDFCPDPSVVLLALSFCLAVRITSFLFFFYYYYFFPPGRLGLGEVVNTRCE